MQIQSMYDDSGGPLESSEMAMVDMKTAFMGWPITANVDPVSDLISVMDFCASFFPWNFLFIFSFFVFVQFCYKS
jgi:hypothetical protein